MKKLPTATLFSLFACPVLALAAGQMTVSIDGFADPASFMITSGDNLSLRVSELVPAANTNSSTHVLIEGLSPLEDGTLVYTSTYSGINVDSGEIQDSGVLYLEMPEGSTPGEGTVVSPIVGVVQRAGSWADWNPSVPDTTLNGSTGAGSYDSGSLTLNLVMNAEPVTGSTTYTVVDSNTIELDGFTASKGGSTYDLSGATLIRDGGRFYGTLTNLSDTPPYDSLLFTVEFTQIPDDDGDGVPDIADGEILSTLTPGVWQNTQIGYVYGYAGNWGYSYHMGWVKVMFPWVYQVNHGWSYLGFSSQNAPGFAMYHYNMEMEGWLFTDYGYSTLFWVVGSDPVMIGDYLVP